MIFQILIFILSLAGIAESAYLLRKKMEKKRPLCFIGKECHKVLESKYGKLLGVPNELLGALFYAAAAALAILQWEILLKAAIFAGTIFSFFLFYLQWRVIKAWCFWCLISAMTVFLMAVSVLLI